MTDSNDLNRMYRNQSKLTPKLTNLYRTELDLNIFRWSYFSLQEKFIWPKINWSKISQAIIDAIWNQNENDSGWSDLNLTWFKSKPNNLFIRFSESVIRELVMMLLEFQFRSCTFNIALFLLFYVFSFDLNTLFFPACSIYSFPNFSHDHI